MSREIKFRVFDKKSGKIFPVTDVYSVNSTGINGRKVRIIGRAVMHGNSYMASTDLLPRSRTILMQFTGLKDKNGVEAYADDIFIPWDDDRTYQIIWDDDYAAFKCKQIAGHKWPCDMLMIGYSKIIGNPHENPELLK